MNNKFFLPILLYVFVVYALSARGKCIVKKPEKIHKPKPINSAKYVVDAQMFIQGYEWGPAIPKIVVEFEDKVTGVDKDTFILKTGNITRVILDVYNSNKDGKQKKQSTNFVTFDLKVCTVFIDLINSSIGDASPFTFDYATSRSVWPEMLDLNLELVENKSFKVGKTVYGKDIAFKTFTKNLMENYVIPESANWEKDKFTLGDITLQRASFTPKSAKRDGVKNPLIIWLHGAGEGGVDVDIALLGNEVTALARKDIQKYFTTKKQKAAYILVVQTPTIWMDKSDGTYNTDIEPGKKQTSIYEDALFAAIKDYVTNNKDIDTKRIYVGGCSNGGYMTMDLMFEHAYMNKNVSDEMIEGAKNANIWFLQSEDDTTIDPLSSTIPAYYRLLKAGAKNVHLTLTDEVRGEDYPNAHYMGHYSWVYAFNDNVKTEFDNAKALADFENVTFDKETGLITSTKNYITHANCTKKGNMWAWLAEQSM
ncbi:hypothetical protein BCR36DRAFT_404994 [Piromyces finnis]|uniref:Esterase Ig-like N-terminal domain-containing protein n=1 Tax=Piromyces finnis TaxID=1754191 RepID=A0A1Y1V8X0_9FUNG|nr:hypothetical protein BCR36DRAFT_404994 [Piromyces finnis]|eukprot:ORX48709.1 hypothetical protein BCR36DRAFT_404994 [Piromyces finnis]